MFKIFFNSSLLMITTFTLVAQKTVTTTGGSFTTNDYSIDYSVGQVGHTVVENNDYAITQGVIQVFEINSPTVGIDNLIGISVFPNPTSNLLKIESTLENLNFRLYDLTGQLVKEGFIRNKAINISDLAASKYLLLISHKSENTRKFKIVKN